MGVETTDDARPAVDRHTTKSELFELGKAHIAKWCELNGVDPPKVNPRMGKPDFGTCAYYRDGEIEIWVNSCAAVGLAGRQWSFPGYVVDRTPYGVLAHELGHHVDRQDRPEVFCRTCGGLSTQKVLPRIARTTTNGLRSSFASTSRIRIYSSPYDHRSKTCS